MGSSYDTYLTTYIRLLIGTYKAYLARYKDVDWLIPCMFNKILGS